MNKMETLLKETKTITWTLFDEVGATRNCLDKTLMSILKMLEDLNERVEKLEKSQMTKEDSGL